MNHWFKENCYQWLSALDHWLAIDNGLWIILVHALAGDQWWTIVYQPLAIQSRSQQMAKKFKTIDSKRYSPWALNCSFNYAKHGKLTEDCIQNWVNWVFPKARLSYHWKIVYQLGWRYLWTPKIVWDNHQGMWEGGLWTAGSDWTTCYLRNWSTSTMSNIRFTMCRHPKNAWAHRKVGMVNRSLGRLAWTNWWSWFMVDELLIDRICWWLVTLQSSLLVSDGWLVGNHHQEPMAGVVRLPSNTQIQGGQLGSQAQYPPQAFAS